MGKTMSFSGKRRLTLLAVLLLALLAALGVAAQEAAAHSSSYVHGGATCTSCHGANLGDPAFTIPTADTTCTQCHTGGFESRQTVGTARTCWTCHDPGQDMSGVQGVGCAAAAAGCHSDAPHYGSNTLTCTSCHGTVAAYNDPDGSAHHNNTAKIAPTTCTDCHTQANGLHADFVAGAACTTCHVGFDAAHPDPSAMVSPTVAVVAKPAIVKFGLTTIVSGSVKNGLAPIPGATVLLQQKPFGTTAFTAVGEAVTGTDGTYTFAATSPTLLTTYRVVAHGVVVSSVVVKPGFGAADVKVSRALTIALAKTRFLLGGKQTIKGTVNPAWPGGLVTLQIQHKTSVWKTMLTKSVPFSSLTGSTTYSFGYKPPVKASSRGSWRVKASIKGTTELLGAVTVWKTWTVK
jgi:hypothetical protein